MTKFFETIECPNCSQEKLIIARSAEGQLYLHCCECIAAWNCIDDVKNPGKMFIDVSEDSIDPSFQDVRDAGWEKYITSILDV